MKSTDLNAECRRAWLRQEQQPCIRQQTPQSNFEQSPYWRICFFVAVVIIGIQAFTPDPDATVDSRHSTVQTGHVRPMV